MGASMARRLVDQEYRVAAVHDRDQARSHELAAELGCLAAKTPVEVASLSTVIVTVVNDDAGMREIYGPNHAEGLLPSAEGSLFVNCATVTPQVHIEVESLVEQRGGSVLEACMASSITQARNGTLYLMCGCRPEVFERARPLLRSLSASLRYVGSAVQAATVKALVNMVMNINTSGLAKGLATGRRA